MRFLIAAIIGVFAAEAVKRNDKLTHLSLAEISSSNNNALQIAQSLQELSAHAATLSEVISQNKDGDIVIKIGETVEEGDDYSTDIADKENVVIKIGDTVEEDDDSVVEADDEKLVIKIGETVEEDDDSVVEAVDEKLIIKIGDTVEKEYDDSAN